MPKSTLARLFRTVRWVHRAVGRSRHVCVDLSVKGTVWRKKESSRAESRYTKKNGPVSTKKTPCLYFHFVICTSTVPKSKSKFTSTNINNYIRRNMSKIKLNCNGNPHNSHAQHKQCCVTQTVTVKIKCPHQTLHLLPKDLNLVPIVTGGFRTFCYW